MCVEMQGVMFLWKFTKSRRALFTIFREKFHGN